MREEFVEDAGKSFFFESEFTGVGLNYKTILTFWERITSPFYRDTDLGLSWETVKFFSLETE